MRNLIILLLFGCLAARAFSRPATAEDVTDSEGDEADYEGGNEEGDSEENIQSDEDMRLGEQFPGYKSERSNDFEEAPEEPSSNNEYKSFKKRHPNKYLERNKMSCQRDTEQRLLEGDDNLRSPKNEKNPLKKRTPSSISVSNDDREVLYQGEKEDHDKIGKREYQSEPVDVSEESHFKKLYSSLPSDKRFDYRINYNRDRRAAEDNDTFATSKVEDIEVATENEEEAIKRHVKKLSSEELEELLSSLTEDKRELLKKIMESDTGTENEINKREITKKAGAEENGFVESGHSDTSKLQEGSVVAESNVQSPSTETSKQSNAPSEITILPVTNKPVDNSNITFASLIPENKADLTFQDPEINPRKSDSSLISTGAPCAESNNQGKIANLQEPSKIETKRETNFESPSASSIAESKVNNDLNSNDLQNDLQNDSGYFFSQDDDLAQVCDDEEEIANNNENNNNMLKKREALMDKYLADSVKSLEESFPNSNSYDDDDPYSGSDMAPLVRVKRKNSDLTLKKRAAGVLPEAKVAYFPYRAENDDDDNDEGSEFDDDGFYDRTSNLEKTNLKPLPQDESPNDFENAVHQPKMSDDIAEPKQACRSKLSQSNNMQCDTMSLGSDTDSVLSGAEGVDDNLMYNSGSRIRRTADCKIEDHVCDDKAGIKQNRNIRSTPMIDEEVNSASASFVNAPNYHESDAFGPLPRSYEGESGRYKRIRRVKQPSASQDIASPNT